MPSSPIHDDNRGNEYQGKRKSGADSEWSNREKEDDRAERAPRQLLPAAEWSPGAGLMHR
jgi:hypothetical protein